MPNGIDWEKISGDKAHPIEKMLPVLQLFAKQNNLRLTYSTYHDGLEVELSSEYKRKSLKEFIRKEIHLGLIDKTLYKSLHKIDLSNECEEKIYCRMNVEVFTHYGLKDIIFALIPVLRPIRKKWSRKYWSQVIGSLVFPIDIRKLTFLLEQAKQILDNFDESLLQEVKQP